MSDPDDCPPGRDHNLQYNASYAPDGGWWIVRISYLHHTYNLRTPNDVGRFAITIAMAIGWIVFCCFLGTCLRHYLKMRRLQLAGVPMPVSFVPFSHLVVLKEVMRALPANCTFHVVMQRLSRQFPNGIFYLDLWPFSKILMVVFSPNAAGQVESAFLDKPDDIVDPLNTITGGPSLLTMRGDTWKEWRGVFNRGFSTSYMTNLAPAIAEEVAVFFQLLMERATKGDIFQLEEMTLRMTFDVIARVTLSCRLKYQTQDNALASALRTQIYWTSFGTTFNPFRRYLNPRPLVQWYNSHRMNQYLGQQIDKQYEEGRQEKNSQQSPNSKSIISLALDEYFRNHGDSGRASKDTFRRVVMPQLRLFLYAGHDTISSTLLYCYYLLYTHPEILQKTRSEHSQIYGVEHSIAHIVDVISTEPSRLNQLPYTSAVIKEVLRIFPPSASMRYGREDLELVDDDGQRCPTEGCFIWTLNLALHSNPRIWVKPGDFIPERWLVGPEDPLYPKKGSWRAFEAGARNCIGQTLALLELRIALVMTLRLCDIAPAYEEWDRLQPSKGIRTVDGNRVYQSEMGGGGAHPAQAYPCRVTIRT